MELLERIVRELGELADREHELTEEEAARWYALVQLLRQRADYYERRLIRSLRWEDGDEGRTVVRTWAQIADVVQANLGSRQAAHAKWKRLIEPDRREHGGAGRGGWQRGRKRVQ